jgi:hypothetical protein
MKSSFFVIISLLASTTLGATEYKEWVKIQFDPGIDQIQLMVLDGTIEPELADANQGWMLSKDYDHYSKYFNLQELGTESRKVIAPNIPSSPDSVGEVLAIYPMPPGVPSERGLGFDGTYFYVVSAQTNNERVYKLDPNNNFAVVNSFPSPGTGSKLPWGIESDTRSLYIADAISDLIFKTDTIGTVIASFPTGGPIATGLGYRTNELWNGDIGTAPIPPRVYKSDTLGTPLSNYTQSVTVNGIACSDSAVFLGRNINNGHDIRAMDPTTFVQLYSFVSPLDYPNGLAFDGTYLWICGRTSGVQYIVKVDVGLTPEPPQPNISFSADTLDFGEVRIISEDSTLQLSIWNIGVTTLAVDSLYTQDSVYTISESGPFTIEPDSIRILSVTFSPTEMNTYVSRLIVESNAANLPVAEIVLTGIGINPQAVSHTPAPITKYKLFDNFPNPFNPTTSIRFQIPDFESVSIKIHDITGRDVATIVSERLRPGKYEYKWDAGNFASGIYFYRLKVGDVFVQTKRMLLLK